MDTLQQDIYEIETAISSFPMVTDPIVTWPQILSYLKELKEYREKYGEQRQM